MCLSVPHVAPFFVPDVHELLQAVHPFREHHRNYQVSVPVIFQLCLFSGPRSLYVLISLGPVCDTWGLYSSPQLHLREALVSASPRLSDVQRKLLFKRESNNKARFRDPCL